jgi:hypothetical protein
MLNQILGGTMVADREREIQVAVRRRQLIDSGGPGKAAPPTPQRANRGPRRLDGRSPAAL